MLAADEMASRVPQWMRALLVGCLVVLVTGAGLFAYRHFTAPKTMTIAAGSFDGEAARLMSAIATQLTKTGAGIRLKIVDTGTELGASEAFSAGKVDLAIVRADVGDLSAARTVVLVTYGVADDHGAARFFRSKTWTTLKERPSVSSAGMSISASSRCSRREYDLTAAEGALQGSATADVQNALRSKQVRRSARGRAHLGKISISGSKLLSGERQAKPGLVPIDAAEAIATLAQAYESYDLPKGSLRGSPPIPDDDLTTLRVPFYLVANKNLDADQVTDLTQAVMDVRSRCSAPSIRFSRRSAHRAPIRTRTFLSIPEPQLSTMALSAELLR